MEQFDLSKKVQYARRVCGKIPAAKKRLNWIEEHTTILLDEPIYEVEFKLKAVLAQGLIPLDIIGEVNKAMGEVYKLLLEHQKESYFD